MIDVLVVNEPFGGYERGAVIDDPKMMAEVLASEHAAHVIRTQREAPPAKASK